MDSNQTLRLIFSCNDMDTQGALNDASIITQITNTMEEPM